MAKRSRSRGDGSGKIKVSKPKGALGSTYLPAMLPQVKARAMAGLTDDEIADIYGVDRSLFSKWKETYPDFRRAVDSGRAMADADVIMALHKRAVGYTYEEDGLTRTGRVKALKRHMAGDVGAQKYWLNNRQREKWRERNNLELGGSTEPGAKPIGVTGPKSKTEMITEILKMIRPKPDGETSPSKTK